MAREGFSFVVFGDPQMQNEVTRRIIGQITREEAEFCLILGDLVNDANDLSQWKRFREICRPLHEKFPVYTTPGNHDYQHGGRTDSYKTYARPGNTSYTFVHRRCRFFMLDTFQDGSLSETRKADEGEFRSESVQYRWLEQGLRSASVDGETAFVGLHHPVFMATSLYFSTSPTIRADETVSPHTFGNLLPLLVRYDVQMTFGGHIHVYEHCVHRDIDLITTGATGFELFCPEETANAYRVRAEARHHYCRVQVLADRVVLEAVDVDGEVFDRIERRRKPDA